MSRFLWPVFVFVLFAGTLLAELPASLVIAQVLPGGTPMAIEDVRGSIWHGKAMHVGWNDHALGALAWTMRPDALLLGKLDAVLQLTGEVTATTRLIQDPKSTTLINFEGQLPASLLQNLRGRAALRAQGQVRATIPFARITGNRFTAATGEVTWHAATLRSTSSVALGTLRARFGLADDQCIHGTIQADEAALATRGTFAGDLSHYQARITLSPKTSQHSPLLNWLGQSGSNGNRVLQFDGGQATTACRLPDSPR